MINEKTGEATAPSDSGEETYMNSAKSAELRRSILGEPEERYFEAEQEELEEILLPLLQLLNLEYHDGWAEEFVITNGGPFRVEGDGDGVLIELPECPAKHPLLAKVLATLLSRSGSSCLWMGESSGEEDPYRTPLRFSIVKRVIAIPDASSILLSGLHLLVDHIGDLEGGAAERQVALLVEFLNDPNNLVDLGPEDLRIF